MTHSISCVLLVPGEQQITVNDLAESIGYGPDNLSVELLTPEGAKWYGCHTWCRQDFIDRILDPESGSAWPESMIVSAIDGGDPMANWRQALVDNGLSEIQTIPQ